MIEGKKYVEVAKEYFGYLISEFGFKISNEKIRGNAFYDLQYTDKISVVSISYENIEDYFQVIVFILQNGELPDYDDKTKTLHLNKLNAEVLPRIDISEISLNNDCFSKFNPQEELERKMLKSARDLRLCLKHFTREMIARAIKN